MASLFVLLFVLPAGLDAGDAIDLGDSAHYFGLEVPAEGGIGDEMTVTVHFGTDEPLADDVHIFLHIQSQQSTCRMVRDEQPTVAEDGTIAHEFQVTIPELPVCHPQRMEIYTGLYHRGRGGRFPVHGVTTTDDRIHAGYFDIVEGGTSAPRAIAPSDMKIQKFLSLAQPFDWWLLGLLISIVLTIGLRFWMGRRPETETETEEDDPERPRGRDPAPEAPPGAEGAGGGRVAPHNSGEESDAVRASARGDATGAGAAEPREAPATKQESDEEDDDPYAEDEEEDEDEDDER